MLPFEDYKPITLDRDDPLFKGINDIVDGIKSEVMLQNVDPRENRDIALKKVRWHEKEKFERKNPQMRPSEEDFEKNTCLRDLNNTFKNYKDTRSNCKESMETLKKEQILN